MADKVPKNKLVNPYRRSQREKGEPACAEPPLDPVAADARALADASEAFVDVFNSFRREEPEE